MQLRNRSLADETVMWDEEEALIDQEKEEEEEGTSRDEDTKKGIAGDERNILVLLFLYVLQVCLSKVLFSSLMHCKLFRAFPWAWRQLFP